MLRTKLKHPDAREAYADLFRSWDKQDIISRIHQADNEHAFYLPHFPVFKQSDPSKVRPVFDASAKFGSDKKSLNSALFCGPNLMNELPQVLLRFRAKPIAVTSDIKDMFLRIRLQEQDKPFHRFLWQDENGDIVDFQFNSSAAHA